MNKSAKIIHLRVSVGDNDKRTMEKFRKDIVDALETYAHPKNVTVMGEEHLFEGQRYSVPEWDALQKQGVREMLAREADEAEAVAEAQEGERDASS